MKTGDMAEGGRGALVSQMDGGSGLRGGGMEGAIEGRRQGRVHLLILRAGGQGREGADRRGSRLDVTGK